MAVRERYRRESLVVLAFALGVALRGHAQAVTVTFRLDRPEEPRTVAVEPVDREGVMYVSLTRITAEFGGGCAILPTRAQIDFGGKTAWIRINDKEVNGSADRFSLSRPILRDRNEILMALEDVGAFFAKAFRVTVELERSGGQSVSPELTRESPVVATNLEEPPSLEGLPSPPATRRTLKVMVIDPGHGGSDLGAVGAGNVQEKDVTLAIARECQSRLQESLHIPVLLTREGQDVEWPDRARSRFAQVSRADLFLSIHTGASFSRLAHGFEVFYYGGAYRSAGSRTSPSRAPAPPGKESRALAETLARTLQQATSVPCRGVREMPCRVLAETGVPAVLIEVGCVTNPAEEALLATPEHRERIAQGILSGIQEFVAQAPKQGEGP